MAEQNVVYNINELSTKPFPSEVAAATMGAIASSAGEWNALDKKNLTPEQLNKKAEEIALGAADNTKNPFHDNAPPALVKAYTEDLVARTKEKDKTNPLPGGKTHLLAYMEEIGAATPTGNNFDEVQKGKITKDNLTDASGKPTTITAIKEAYAAAAKENVGMKGTLQEDFKATITDDLAKGADSKFAKVDMHQTAGTGFMDKAAFASKSAPFVAALIQEMAQPKNEKQAPATTTPATTPATKPEQHADAGFNMDKVMAFVEQMPKIAEKAVETFLHTAGHVADATPVVKAASVDKGSRSA